MVVGLDTVLTNLNSAQHASVVVSGYPQSSTVLQDFKVSKAAFVAYICVTMCEKL